MQKLSERALLVQFTAGYWLGQKTDRRALEAVEERYSTTSEAGEFRKRLLARGSSLDKLISRIKQARVRHKSLTLPWFEGVDIIGSGAYMSYVEAIRKEKAEVHQLKEQFLEEYPRLKEQATHLGTLKNAWEYPSVDSLRERFYIHIRFLPVPETDFRCQLGDDDKEQLVDTLSSEAEALTAAAVQEAHGRLRKGLENLVEKLSSYGPGKRLHESTVSSLLELADILPVLNIAHSPELDEAAQEIRRKLSAPDVDGLKKDQAYRDSYVDEATKILERLKQFGVPQTGDLPEQDEAQAEASSPTLTHDVDRIKAKLDAMLERSRGK